MKHRLCLASAVLLLVAAPATAGAAPNPSYDITCTVGVQTIVNWRHAKVTGITFTWLAPANSSVTFPPMPVSVPSTKKRGFAVVPTASSVGGVNPAHVTLSVTLAGGGTDEAGADCS